MPPYLKSLIKVPPTFVARFMLVPQIAVFSDNRLDYKTKYYKLVNKKKNLSQTFSLKCLFLFTPCLSISLFAPCGLFYIEKEQKYNFVNFYHVWDDQPLWMNNYIFPYAPTYEPTNIWAASWQNQQSECAPSEDSDQPGHPLSLIRVFAVRMKKAWTLTHWVHSEDSGQTGRIPRLIWVFAGRTATLLVLSRGGSFIHILYHWELTVSIKVIFFPSKGNIILH